MRAPPLDEIGAAVRAADDARGAGALLGLLGYRLIEPPDGVALPLDAPESAGLELRHVASGGGVEALLVVDGTTSAAARTARLRMLLGRGPRPVLVLWPAGAELTVASGGLDGAARALTFSRDAPRAAEIEALLELAPHQDGVVATLSRHARALDRSSLTRRFFRDFRAQRDAVSAAWTGIQPRAKAERDQLALLFLSRLVFLYFLQKQGHLLGRSDYLPGLVRDASAQGAIYRRVVTPLFFGVLNRPPDQRDEDARRLGALPYLNGGLFERHAIERAHADLDLPDDVLVGVFTHLLERYRFTTSERGAGDAPGFGVQPEMLGRMFEELMEADRRGATGTFYTPAPVVDRIVGQALHAWLSGRPGMDGRAAAMLLRERGPAYGDDSGGSGIAPPPELVDDVRALRVLDPACGSGAFVLGALGRLARLRRTLDGASDEDGVRRELASSALHGVDVEPDAALLCALRIWLALTPVAGGGAPVRPLPNLDHRVRQGDALIDPLDLAARGSASAPVWRAAALDARVRRARRVVTALVGRYARADADARIRLRDRLDRAEARLARRWLAAALERLGTGRRRLHADARTRDLFGQRVADRAHRTQLAGLRGAREELRRLARRLRDDDALPFFSFDIHFAAGDGRERRGFDLVVSNPPWVRSHRWPRAFNEMIRSRYRVCGGRAWRGGSAAGRAASGGQVDLALLFLERGLDLLAPGGVLAMLLPAKSFRSLSAGGARALLAQRAHLVVLEDHSLHHRAIFRADAFAGVVVARATDSARTAGSARAPRVRVTMTHRAAGRLRFSAHAHELALDPGDPRSPWLLAPPDVCAALRAMQSNGRALGLHEALPIRRGVMTGGNDLLLFERAERKLGDAVVAWPRRARPTDPPPGSVLLAPGDLCPVVRGAGIRPFRFVPDGFLAWCHDDATAAPRAPSRRLERHLASRRARLRARTGWRDGLPDGVLFRLDDAMLKPRVAWRDIAEDLEVALLPATVPALGTRRPVVALNTVYFVAVDDEAIGYALGALLSSLPVRVFARTIAERAKDARFRFMAWTLAAVPLPCAWSEPGALRTLEALGRAAHQTAASDGDLTGIRAEIDDFVARRYALDERAVAALRRFDRWLRGERAGRDRPPRSVRRRTAPTGGER